MDYGEAINVVSRVSKKNAFKWTQLAGNTGATPAKEAELLRRTKDNFPTAVKANTVEALRHYVPMLRAALKASGNADPAIPESFVFKPHMTVDQLENQAWLELAPDISDQAPVKRSWAATVGCMVVRSSGVALCQATVLIEGRVWAVPHHCFVKGLDALADGELVYLRFGSRSSEAGRKATWVSVLAKPLHVAAVAKNAVARTGMRWLLSELMRTTGLLISSPWTMEPWEHG